MPVIGLTSNRCVEDRVHRDRVRRRYIDTLHTHAGTEVIILPTRNHKDGGVLEILERLDGLVLTGDDSDLDEGVITGGPSPPGDEYRPDERDIYRDRLSHMALSAALQLCMPVLGICRGLQELNVFLGGTLHKDLRRLPSMLRHQEDLSLPRDRQYDAVHPVEFSGTGRISHIVGSSAGMVNSLHRQGIDRLAPGLIAEAISPDGLVEAVRVDGPSPFQIAVQWHPEWHADTDLLSQKLFAAFGKACAEFRHAGSLAAGQAAHLYPLPKREFQAVDGRAPAQPGLHHGPARRK